MRRLLLGAAMALLALGSTSPSFGDSGLIKVNAPMDHQFKFGAKKPKRQSGPETAWICQTPVSWCHLWMSNGIGTPCHCWGVWGVITG
jgi:hypothetical protein